MTTFFPGARAYNEYMGGWSERLAPPFADFAGVEAGEGRHRVLDVGCGPGALTAELARRLGAASVSAIDPTPDFVHATRNRLPGVDVRDASAEDLPFPDATFDVAMAQLVVHFMLDPVAGLGEMARVTRPGGVVAACVWDYGGARGPLGPFWEAARALDPDVDQESDRAGAREGALAALFAAANLEAVEAVAIPVTCEFASFDAWWHPFTLRVGPAGVVYTSPRSIRSR
ncbi:MAG: class I SAM-dependent methyltransferase [Dehalococcoidia bacterium]